MRFDRFVASRYLRAKRKQAFIGVISLITLIGITLGVASLNIALSVHNGMRAAFMTSLIGDTGTLHILARQIYFEDMSEKEQREQDDGFSPSDLNAITNTLSSMPGVQAFTLMREEPGVVLTRNRSLKFAKFNGISPEQFMATSNRLDQMEVGSVSALENRPAGAPPGILLGYDLARNLGARQGDTIQIAVGKLKSAGLGYGRRSGLQLREMKCQVVGIFKTGNSQFDEFDAYLLIESLFKMLNTQRIQSLQVSFKSVEEMDAVKQSLVLDMPIMASVIDFRDLNMGLLDALNLEKLATTVVITLFIVIVALNMVSALIMMVMEKHRDIGIMKSFGTPAWQIRKIFVRQGMTLSLQGTFMGTVLGVGSAMIADATRLIKLDNKVYEVLSYLPFKINPLEVFLVALGSLVLAWVSTQYPAAQAAAMDPVEALKYD